MFDLRKIDGYWWLPDKPDKKISGILTYSPTEGFILELNGVFDDIIDESPDYHKFIIGDSQKGDTITIHCCFLIQSSHSIPCYAKSKYIANIGYIGYHFSNEKQIMFSRISMRYDFFEEWLNYRVFSHHTEETKESKYKHTLTYESPGSINIKVQDYTLEIYYGFSSSSGDNWREDKIKTYARIYVDFNKPLTLDASFAFVNHFRNFITLGTGDCIDIIEFRGKNDDMKDNQWVEILFRISSIKKMTKKLYPFQMIYTFRNIESNPSFYLNNWFEKIGSLEPIYNLFFAILYIPNIYPLHEFLSLTQAIEAYHSRKFNNDFLLLREFKQFRKKIIKNIEDLSEEYKDHFFTKVSYINKKILRIKLKELFIKYQYITNCVTDDIDEFINKIADTRNYYTHYDEKLKKKAVVIKDLPLLSQKILFFLVGILLREIGFDEDQIIIGIQKYKRKWEITKIL